MNATAPQPCATLPTFKAAVYAYVSSDPTIISLIGQLELAKVSEDVGFPAITYQISQRVQPVILDGPAQHDEVNCEIKIRAAKNANGDNNASEIVDQIALTIRALFNGKPAWDMAGLPVMASWVDDDSDDYDTADDASDEGAYVQIVNIFVRHRLA